MVRKRCVAYLGIHGGIPVRIIEDDGVSTRQVHAHATTPCRQDEDEDLWIGVETLHQDLQRHSGFWMSAKTGLLTGHSSRITALAA